MSRFILDQLAFSPSHSVQCQEATLRELSILGVHSSAQRLTHAIQVLLGLNHTTFKVFFNNLRVCSLTCKCLPIRSFSFASSCLFTCFV